MMYSIMDSPTVRIFAFTMVIILIWAKHVDEERDANLLQAKLYQQRYDSAMTELRIINMDTNNLYRKDPLIRTRFNIYCKNTYGNK